MHTAILLIALCAFTSARAGGLENLNQVDLVELEPRTSQLQLLVLLEDDRVNTKQAMKALFRKLNNYQDFINSGQALAVAPNSSQKLRPVVVLVAPREATSGELQNLAGLKLAALRAGAEVEVWPHVAGIKARPIAIRPPRSASGA